MIPAFGRGAYRCGRLVPASWAVFFCFSHNVLSCQYFYECSALAPRSAKGLVSWMEGLHHFRRHGLVHVFPHGHSPLKFVCKVLRLASLYFSSEILVMCRRDACEFQCRTNLPENVCHLFLLHHFEGSFLSSKELSLFLRLGITRMPQYRRVIFIFF